MYSKSFSYKESEVSWFPQLVEIFPKRVQSSGDIIVYQHANLNAIKDSLWIFSSENKYRVLSSKIVRSQWFETLIICLIILNSIFLGVADYENPNKSSFRNDLVKYAEPFFIFAFTIEALLKIVAFGFVIDKNTYLRDPWNWLDFIVVVTSLLTLVPNMANVSVIRTFRLFRPLRSFTALPAMKSIIATMLKSLSKLSEIMIVAVIFFYIFSILGVSLWAGDTHYRCRETPHPIRGDWVAIAEDTRVWGSRECGVGFWGSLVEQYDNHPETLDIDVIGR